MAMRGRIVVDNVTVELLKKRLAAVEATAAVPWHGEVITGPRPPTSFDPTPMHGRQVVRELRSRGHDPMRIVPQRLGAARRMLRVDIVKALRRAERDARPHPLMVQAAVRRATQYLAQGLIDRITSGRLGHNSPATVSIKMQLIAIGQATTAYGRPPPYGIQTGRFVRTIKARVSRGRGRAGAPIRSVSIVHV